MKVLQLIDSLEAGGAERMAVNLANLLVSHTDRSYLCATRKEGPLKSAINQNVGYLFLNRNKLIDIHAFKLLKSFIKENTITHIHAHSTSFFMASWIKIRLPHIKLIWHDHYGNSEFLFKRKYKTLRLASFTFNAIISVNKTLQSWASLHLNCKKVYYMGNFILKSSTEKPSINIKGAKELKIVCVANFRPQKDHLNLLKAYKILLEKGLNCSLHLFGIKEDNIYTRSLDDYIDEFDIRNVYFYGSQKGILPLLKTCDIGVLSSNSEGLPLALLEYGLSQLAVVCTDVGECKEVVKEYGIIVNPHDPNALATGILKYKDENLRMKDGTNFRNHVLKHYSSQNAIKELKKIYLNS